MTLESTQIKMIYEGNGAATVFPVPYQYSETDTLIPLLTDASGKDSILTDNYRIEVNESGDTNLVYPVEGSPMPSGTRLTIYRQTPLTQIVDLVYGGAFNPNVLEHDGFDRVVMMIQELKEALDRAIKVSISSDMDPDAYWQALQDALGYLMEVERLYNLLIEAGVIIQPATATRLGGVMVGDGLSVTESGLLSFALQNGGGLAFDGSGQVAVDFSTMPTDKFEALLASLRVPIWMPRNTTWYVDAVNGSDSFAANDVSTKGQTTGTAFKTLQAAIDFVTGYFNFGAFHGTISIISTVPLVYPGIVLRQYSTAGGALTISANSKVTIETYVETVPNAGSYSLRNIKWICPGIGNSGGAYTRHVYIGRGVFVSFYECDFDYSNVPPTNTLDAISVLDGGICSFLIATDTSPPMKFTGYIGRLFLVTSSGLMLVRSDMDFDMTTRTTSWCYIFDVKNLGQMNRQVKSNSNPVMPVMTGDISISGTATIVKASVQGNSIFNSGGGGGDAWIPFGTSAPPTSGGQII